MQQKGATVLMNTRKNIPSPKVFRAIWISDVHLGIPAAKSKALLQFLKNTRSEYLYLVGDIIDIWEVRKRPYWTSDENNVIRQILKIADLGTKVVFIPGNHDEFFRKFEGQDYGGINVQLNAIHETADGRKFLMIHGDEFDGVIKHIKPLAYLGSWSYTQLLFLTQKLNIIRRKAGFSYWSLSKFLKQKVKDTVKYISGYERAVASKAKEYGVEGVICGHIHTPEMTEIDEITYCNLGDWVESCTALVEHKNGKLEILIWEEFAKDLGL